MQDESININLNGNKLTLSQKGGWKLQSEDFQMALVEISRLVEEKEHLGKTLELALHQIEQLTQEVRQVNQTKVSLMEDLVKERQQRIALENCVEGYKEELKESYRVIVELRYRTHFPLPSCQCCSGSLLSQYFLVGAISLKIMKVGKIRRLLTKTVETLALATTYVYNRGDH